MALTEQERFAYWITRVVHAADDEAATPNEECSEPTEDERQTMTAVLRYLENPKPPTDRAQALFAGIVLALSAEF